MLIGDNNLIDFLNLNDNVVVTDDKGDFKIMGSEEFISGFAPKMDDYIELEDGFEIILKNKKKIKVEAL